jgi:hypothetical protein
MMVRHGAAKSTGTTNPVAPRGWLAAPGVVA